MLTHPLQDLETWLLFFSGADLPVLRHTAKKLADMREDIDRVNRRELTRVILQDPLMTVKVLAYIQPFAGKSLRSDITTIASAVTMIGIEPFFEKFKELITIEHMPQMPSRQSLSKAIGSSPLEMSDSLSTSSISRKDMSPEMSASW